MPIIGNPLNSVAFLTDSFNGNGSTTAFTMSVAPATSSSILVNITGVTQAPSTYSVVGTTLTFSTAPPSGTANISVRYLGIPASGVTTTAYRTLTEFTATASQTTFTPPSYTVGFLNVYRNGVMLGSADYTATNGTTVVLAVGALVGDLVTTESFYVSSVLNAIPVTGGTISGNLVVTGTASINNPHTMQVFTSGSGTYTLPTGCKAIKVTMCGGGGGGAGGGTSPGAGGTGGTTTFGTSLLTCVGGGGPTNYAQASGGASTLNSPAVGLSFTGQTSSPGTYSLVNAQGANGGSTIFGGGGAGGNAGASNGNGGTVNTGSGGGGGGYSASGSSGAGGGSGGYLLALISSPSATYSYAVGAGSAGGTAGGTGGAGGAGAAGVILVEEFYV